MQFSTRKNHKVNSFHFPHIPTYINSLFQRHTAFRVTLLDSQWLLCTGYWCCNQTTVSSWGYPLSCRIVSTPGGRGRGKSIVRENSPFIVGYICFRRKWHFIFFGWNLWQLGGNAKNNFLNTQYELFLWVFLRCAPAPKYIIYILHIFRNMFRNSLPKKVAPYVWCTIHIYSFDDVVTLGINWGYNQQRTTKCQF